MAQQPAPTPEEVGAMYDQFTDFLTQAMGDQIHAGYWRDAQDTSTTEEATDRMTDMVAARLGVRPGQQVLDVGCGTGKPAVRIARDRGAQVTGISVSERQIERATARPQPGDGPGMATFQLADAMKLPFPDASFDAAWAIESLLHMSDQTAAVKEIARVLRPGGRLVAADLLARGPADGAAGDVISQILELFSVSSLADLDDYRAWVDSAGLRLTEYLDVSDNVRRGYQTTAGIMREAAPTFGADLEPQLTAGAGLLEKFGTLDEIGYALIVAVRR